MWRFLEQSELLGCNGCRRVTRPNPGVVCPGGKPGASAVDAGSFGTTTLKRSRASIRRLRTMKKALLGSTAIVGASLLAAGHAAAKPEITLGGGLDFHM